jgi:hypothetical protein
MKSISDLPNWFKEHILAIFLALFFILLIGIIGYFLLSPIISFVGSGLWRDHTYRIPVVILIGIWTLVVLMLLISWLSSLLIDSRIWLARLIHRTKADTVVLLLLIISGSFSLFLLLPLITDSDPVIIIGLFISLSIFGFCLLLNKLLSNLEDNFYKPYVIIDNKYYYPTTIKDFDGHVCGTYYDDNGYEMRLRENNTCKRCSRLINCTARNDAVVKCDLYSEDERKVKIYGQ